MKKYFLCLLPVIVFSVRVYSQNVGIGISSPAYKLDVSGTIHNTSNLITDGFVGIGTTTPAFPLQVNNGAISLYNTTDSKAWNIDYSSSGHFFSISEAGSTRFAILNGGNVGIGTFSPAYKLDVAGTVHTNYLIADLDVTIAKTLTVNGDKGVAYNLGSALNMKISYFTTPSFSAILAGNGLSVEGSLTLPAGFSNPPHVFVGDIDATGGTAGELYRVQLVVYGCTNTSCKVRLLNTSPNAVNYSTSWNMVAVGF